MITMKINFSTKIACIFCFALVFLLSTATYLIYCNLKIRVTQELGNKLMSIAATTALLIDGDQHGRLSTTGKKNDKDYKEIKLLLQKVKRVNKSQKVSEIYTITKTNKPNIWQFIVDSDESDEAASFKEEYDVSKLNEMKLAFNAPIADKKVNKDRWGVWLSGYAPIHNSKGEAVAIVGLDASANTLYNLQHEVLKKLLLVLALGVILAIPISIISGKMLSKSLKKLFIATEEVNKGNFDYEIQIKSNDEIGHLGKCFNRMLKGLRERDYIKYTFQRYVSQEVVEKILKMPIEERTKGERRNVTILFTDIRGFTSISEKMRAEEILELLNEHFSILIDTLFKYEGTLDKFVGDGMMAIFGAPITHPDDAERAVRSALEMQEKLLKLNYERKKQGKQETNIGIGINSGVVVAGNVGSSKRMEYSVIGDTVNTAARVQAFAKSNEVIITNSTYLQVKDIVKVDKLEPVKFKGKSEILNIYLVKSIS